jgi:hypothetical protein
VLLTLDKIVVHLGFHIFDVLDFNLPIDYPLEISLTSHQGSLAELLREIAFASTTSCSENHLAKLLPEQNLLEEMMHTSPFMSSEPVLLEVTKSSEECNSGNTLHFCEDKRSSSSSIKFKPPSFGPEYVVLDHDRDTTTIFHDASLEMENQWAMEFCEAPTLECDKKDSTHGHGSFTFEIPCKPCSFNATLESVMLSAPCTRKDYNHLIVLFGKIFRRLVVDVYVYRKHCRFRVCTMALTL